MDIKKVSAKLVLAAMTAFPATAALPQQAPAHRPLSALSPDVVEHANRKYLAYVRSSSSSVNDSAEAGLRVLAATLKTRTSFEPVGVVALDINRDDLSLFPFIYWPVTPDAAALSPAAQKKVQNYIDHGGMILFDVNERGASVGNSLALRRLLGGVTIPQLMPMDKDHTLTKSFYLMARLPGTREADPVWVEAPGPAGQENVSSVIIGDNNWASAWSGRSVGIGTKAQEDALRAGVNFVMYALYGDYKADAIHIPTIQAKLGRKP